MADTDFVGRMSPELDLLLPFLDERARRLVLGAVARAAGEGGIGAVAAAAGASWQTVADGAAELAAGDTAPAGRIRRPGGGRKPLTGTDPGLRPALLALVEESARGDPESPLLWTTLSSRDIAAELTRQDHRCSKNAVCGLLAAEGFSLQGNSRTIEGSQHPDRDAQFRYISQAVRGYLVAGDPVISVDTKKKELVGQYASDGRCWRRSGDPVRVRDHDFPGEQAAIAIPYGIYDVAANTGFVNVGTDHDTAAFAVGSIRRWWHAAGKDRYPGSGRLLITADAGGSNSYRIRGWKAELAALAAETGLEITVCHFPPGTSKWNKIEHMLFSQISRTWRARPLASYDIILKTIAATSTAAGLTVAATLDAGRYPLGAEVSDQAMAELEARVITRHDCHGTWNYTLLPSPRPAPPPAPGSPPPAARRDQDAASHPALTGLDPAALADLARDLALPSAALREQQLYTRRGGPRRRAGWDRSPSRRKLTLTDHILATCLHLHLRIAATALAPLFGTDPSTVREAIHDTRTLLHQAGRTIPPGPVRCRTLDDLHRYAATHGITIHAHTPHNTPAHPATPQTHLI
jgi:Rhodopirellula transposase DDE domain